MKKLLLVAAGGAFGSLCRYIISEAITSYPAAILLANLIGVAIAGVVAFRVLTTDNWRLFLIPGMAGGMTTFSSVALIHAQQNSLLGIAYFYGMMAASLFLLYVLHPRQIS